MTIEATTDKATTPPCGCTGGPCCWKPDIIKVPGFNNMELYYSHKGRRIRFPGYDDYASSLDIALISALIRQSRPENHDAAFDVLVDAATKVLAEYDGPRSNSALGAFYADEVLPRCSDETAEVLRSALKLATANKEQR